MERETGVTKDFLESVLGYKIHRFCLHAGSSLGDNYSCDLFGVDIWLDAGTSVTLSIIIKCYPTNVARQMILDSTNSFETELGVYKQVLPELYKIQPKEKLIDLNFPEFIFGQHVPPDKRASLGRPMMPVDNCIILPDLRQKGGFRLRDKFLSFDEPHFSLMVEALAKIHAISWVYKCKSGVMQLHEKYPFLKKTMSQESLSEMEGYKNRCYQMAENIVIGSEKALKGLSYLRTVRDFVQNLYYDSTGYEEQSCTGRTKDTILKKPRDGTVKDEKPWAVLCHGDAWSNNILFRYDNENNPIEVTFVDLQLARESDPFTDLVYCLYLSTSREFRMNHLSKMLHLYYMKFSAICDHFSVPELPGWSWEELNRRFDRARIYGAHMAVYILPIIFKNPEEMQPMEDLERGPTCQQKEQMSEFLTSLSKAEIVHPVLRERFLGVLEELVEDGQRLLQELKNNEKTFLSLRKQVYKARLGVLEVIILLKFVGTHSLQLFSLESKVLN
ncbi:unnamed protein product [Allacma fusca]|uniref:CHK kinase-like domain-containing protein n=1 Tax=Allacma fusca TaxID=39272 RepID=A0A8J2J8H0_9HEXA|nr:unnamed protein product [Allacma fusca]